MVDESTELLDLGQVVLDENRMRPLVLSDEFRDVVDLSVVEVAWNNLADTSGFVAIVASILQIRSVLQFFFRGKVEKLFADGELVVYFFLGQAEIGYVEETWAMSGFWYEGGLAKRTDLLDGILKLPSELFLSSWSIELRNIESCEISPVQLMDSFWNLGVLGNLGKPFDRTARDLSLRHF